MNHLLHFSLDKHCEEKRGFLFEGIISFSRECLQPSVALTRVYFGSAHPWETDAMPQTLGQRRREYCGDRERSTLSLQNADIPNGDGAVAANGTLLRQEFINFVATCDRTGNGGRGNITVTGGDRVITVSFVVSLGNECTVIEV